MEMCSCHDVFLSIIFREAGVDDLNTASREVCDYNNISPCDFAAGTGFIVTYDDLYYFGSPVSSAMNQSIP